MIGPLRQDQAYHRFADARAFLGVANFADVISSLALVAVGLAGLWLLWQQRASPSRFSSLDEWRAYWAFFGAVVLAGVGSAYYHLAPDDARLAWDRLPIAVAFMCLLGAVMSERLGLAGGWQLLALLAALGAASVLYWRLSDDLWPYVVVQFGSLAAVVVICSGLSSRYTAGWTIFGIAALYGAGKLCELHDREIFGLTAGAISGHTLKHLLSAVAIAGLFAWLALRQPVSAGHG
jgi:hypothetical protein